MKTCRLLLFCAALYFFASHAQGVDSSAGPPKQRVAERVKITSENQPPSNHTAVVFMFPKSKPTSIQDLLENVAFALSNSYLMRESFFREDQLIKFSAGERLFWLVNTSNEKSGIIRFNAGHDVRTAIGIEFSFHHVATNLGGHLDGIKANIALNPLPEMALRLADIENIFGTDYKNTDTYSDPSYTHGEGVPVSKAADPMGNRTIEYTSKVGEDITSKIAVRFSSDGLVSSVVVNQEQIK